MPARRILSVWFPRLGAERLLRRAGGMGDLPFAVVGDAGQSQVLVSLSHRAEVAGLSLHERGWTGWDEFPSSVTEQITGIEHRIYSSMFDVDDETWQELHRSRFDRNAWTAPLGRADLRGRRLHFIQDKNRRKDPNKPFVIHIVLFLLSIYNLWPSSINLII